MLSSRNSLSNTDIIRILADMGIQINGVYNRDDLPSTLREGFFVTNLDSKNGEGTHWTGFYYHPLHSIYFDPYGFPAPVEIEKKIKPYIFNDKDIQDIDSTACGYYVIGFIKYLYEKEDKDRYFEAFLNRFSDDTKRMIIFYMIYYIENDIFNHFNQKLFLFN